MYICMVTGNSNHYKNVIYIHFKKILDRVYQLSKEMFMIPRFLLMMPLCLSFALPVLRGSLNKFPDFFVWALLLIVHTWNSSLLRSNLLQLQCTSCTVTTTSGRPHGSPLVWGLPWGLPWGLLWPGMVAPDRVLSMGQTELNYVLMLNWIDWNRTVLTFKVCTYAKLNYLK